VKFLGWTLIKFMPVAVLCCLVACAPPDEPLTINVAKEPQIIPFHPKVEYNMLVNNLFTERHQVKKKQQFTELLQGYKVSEAAWAKLNTLSRKQFDFKRVIAGKNYALYIRPDSVCSLKALVYEMNPVEFVIFHFNDSLRLEYCQKEIVTTERNVAGTIENNLSEAIRGLRVPHEVTNRLVDILGWQIDFQRLQKGDHFRLVYEEKSVDGKPFGVGDISGIYFRHGEKDYWAVPFDQGDGRDYFDLSGNSIRKAFLKYPIEFTHISSRYSLNRFHPVLKVNRPHFGTDLSAATGTPIRAVGDGVVTESGYNSGNGNYVKVKHNGTYATGYLHMSKIGKGIRPGGFVSRGQVIGKVGSTGWATGPHLCYRFWKNGVQVDALKVILPPDKPVRSESLANFECAVNETLSKIGTVNNPLQHALAIR
jgi:murein DD-endopeptidase MepM/ murein hydrolase activator NlpD